MGDKVYTKLGDC